MCIRHEGVSGMNVSAVLLYYILYYIAVHLLYILTLTYIKCYFYYHILCSKSRVSNGQGTICETHRILNELIILLMDFEWSFHNKKVWLPSTFTCHL